jgi:ribosomal protein S18 acetylase RimI-like enzyme
VTAPEVLAAFETNAAALFSEFRGHPSATVVETTDLTCIITGIPLPAMNAVVRSALDPAAADARIRSVRDAMARRQVPWSWWVFPTSRPADLAERLLRAGLVEAPPSPAMALDLAAWTPPEPAAGVSVERVEGQPIWPETARVMARGFELPDDVAPAVEERFGAVLGGPLRWFAARLDGRIVACAMGGRSGDVLGIYNVATLPEARGRGAGSAVTAAVLADGQRMGCRVAVLESSAQGHGVYRRLGFEDVGVVRILVGR